jgi:hypothetical protein
MWHTVFTVHLRRLAANMISSTLIVLAASIPCQKDRTTAIST